MYKKDNKSNPKSYKALIIILLLVLLLGAIYFIYYSRNKSVSESNTGTNNQYINYDSPTDEEKQAGQATKEQTIQQDNQTEQNNTNKNKVNPVISTWGRNSTNKIDINGFIPNIVESDGRCKLVISNETEEVTLEKEARADAQTTICGTFEYGDSLSGTVKMQLYYNSPTSEGYSDILDLDV